MAIGDAAQAAGYPLVAPTDDKRKGWEDINLTRDLIAQLLTTLPEWARVSTAADAARTALGITATTTPTRTATVQADLDYLDGRITATGNAAAGQTNALGAAVNGRLVPVEAGVFNRSPWDRNITWSRRGAWIGDDGSITLGYAPSTRASKQDFTDPDWSVEQLRDIAVYLYRYRAEVAKADADPEYHVGVELGVIADDLHAAGLWQFVIYEGHGDAARPRGVHYELLGLAALWLAQRAFDQLDDITDRLDRLEAARG